MNELKGKVAVVTGGASGIGLATVEAFLEKGCKVVLSDYDVESGEKHVDRLKDKGEVIFIKADVSKEEEVESLVNEAVEKFGSLDIIFNNAGIGAQGETHELSYEDYSKVIKINQDGVFFGSKHAVRKMRENGGGVVINTASILGVVGEPTAFAYNASKGAVVMMTKSLALQYAKDNIRCAAIAPGYVETGMVNREALGEYYDNLVDKHPIGRLGQPEEIAHAAVFIAENEFVTGITLLVDGGYTAL
ncbi:NAD(P)-dependent dehydrogenase, short-chain alcohol dehydrogenase family [Alkalibacterium subtropicum]|uniref:NAD(P)-dependent dehydrogenase, short-chain alcohol dehydrogenase family n=1 Tax=Alkalibacterium subtropicum TaxID=753702 RepID=A0A1I1LE81_9LACT|nr:SDR family oxidoreductase [Alkalibacterium subtropicum]SFC71404.1 NAD(P)-dependent dehydrogenase, short-chain alcohol dehydrogenase family [Alkalibacterium subtropicum]